MGFHKGTIAMQMISTAESEIGYASGWLSEDGTIGFHRTSNGKYWAATDIASGTRICIGDTRKECAEWCEVNAQKIEDRKLSISYIQFVLDFKKKIEKELATL